MDLMIVNALRIEDEDSDAAAGYEGAGCVHKHSLPPLTARMRKEEDMHSQGATP